MIHHLCGDVEAPLPEGPLLTFGYAVPNAKEQLISCMQAQRTLLVDIRLRPASRWNSAWNRDALTRQWGIRYLWKGDSLGNLNYKPEDRSKGILLANPEKGVAEVVQLLKGGYQVILLCACKRAESCHRTRVADLIRAQYSPLTREQPLALHF